MHKRVSVSFRFLRVNRRNRGVSEAPRSATDLKPQLIDTRTFLVYSRSATAKATPCSSI